MTAVGIQLGGRESVRPPDLPTATVGGPAQAAAATPPLAARVADALLWVSALLGAVALAVTGVSLAVGHNPLIVRSGSMSPGIPVGAVAVVGPVAAADLEVGDVIWSANAAGTMVLHRVIALEHTASGGARVTLKGDANDAADPGVVTLREAERLRYVLPGLGYAAEASRTPLAGIVITLLLLGPWVLRRGP